MTDKLVIAELQSEGQYECLSGVDFPVTVAALKVACCAGIYVPYTEIWRITDTPITGHDEDIGGAVYPDTKSIGPVLYFSVNLGEAVIREGRDHD